MIGDGENINNTVRTGSMDDVGTRLKFLTELYELWITGMDILDRYDKHLPNYAEKRKELENASRLLAFHMEKDYKDMSYRQMIDSLPKHGDDIKDNNTKT